VRAISTTSESLAQEGLPEFGSTVNNMVNLLIKLSDADREAHGIWYESIAKEAEEHKDTSVDEHKDETTEDLQ